MNNVDKIKSHIKSLLGKQIRITIHGMRNKKEEVLGTVISISPNIFTVKTRGINRSFSYSDVLIGDIVIRTQ